MKFVKVLVVVAVIAVFVIGCGSDTVRIDEEELTPEQEAQREQMMEQMRQQQQQMMQMQQHMQEQMRQQADQQQR